MVQWVRDYAMGQFGQYDLGAISNTDRYTLFYLSMMGQFFQQIIEDNKSYISRLVERTIKEKSLDETIKFGYEAVSGYPAE